MKMTIPLAPMRFEGAPLCVHGRRMARIAMIAIVCMMALNASDAQEREQGARPFGLDDDDEIIPGFGGGEIVHRFTKRHTEIAGWLMRRYDDNDNDYIDRDEIGYRLRRYGGDPMDSDFDNDGRLSELELAQAIAAEEKRDQRDDRDGDGFTLFDRHDDESGDWRDDDNRYRWSEDRSQSNRTSRRMAYDIISRNDRNQDRELDTFERKDLGINMSQADSNGDNLLSIGELSGWLYRNMSQHTSDLSDVLPDWFFEKDVNEDGQLELSEYCEEFAEREIAQFESMDTNSDGFVTDVELANAKSIVGGSYTAAEGALLPPRTTVRSEIAIEEEAIIDDLKLELTLTHNSLEQLDGFLITPGGDRIELFTAVGGSGDNFEGAIFDDSSRERITRSRPPFRDSYRPEAVDKKEPGLSSLEGEQLQGVWQLEINGSRNQRFGLLHSWSLIVTPRSQSAEDR